MSKYANLKVNVSDNQRQKIIDAIKEYTSVSIQFLHENIVGDHTLAFTESQATHPMNNYAKGQGAVKFCKTQLRHNKTVEGGFLQVLLPLALTPGKFLLSKVLNSLTTGALMGVYSATGERVINKIAGSVVIYIKKVDKACKVYSAGKGLYLSRWKRGDTMGEGLYMKPQGYSSAWSGISFGENSPFRDIPVLGWILFLKINQI
jgi:hypothetical protein